MLLCAENMRLSQMPKLPTRGHVLRLEGLHSGKPQIVWAPVGLTVDNKLSDYSEKIRTKTVMKSHK